MGELEVATEPARAKINPFLRVLGRRDDGSHEIETLVLPVSLADGVQATLADDLRLTVAGELASEVPAGDDNLVLRAAAALREHLGEKRGAHLLLSKRIPVAAGLGGGSADAAATLRALDRLWGCGLGVDGLGTVAASVGSDVPALLFEGPVIARGRGELVEPVDLPRTWWVLVTSEPGIRSGDVYAWWDEDRPVSIGDLTSAIDALRSSPATARVLLANDLEGPVLERRPDVRDVLDRSLAAGAFGAIVSGSGPTVAALVRDGAHAEELADHLGGIPIASASRP